MITFLQSAHNAKEVVLAAVAAFLPVLTFWLWRQFIPLLTAGEYRDFIQFLFPITCLVFAGTIFVLVGIFLRSPRFAYAAALIGIGVSFLLLPATPMVLGAAVFSLLLTAYAVHRMRREFDFSLGFSVSRVSRAGLPVYFSVASILVALMYVAGLNEERVVSALVPRSLIHFFLERLSGENGFFSDLPVVGADTTVDELIREMARREFESQGVSTSSIPERELARLIALQRETLSTQFDIPLSGSEKIGEAFYAAVTEKIEDFFGPYRVFLPVAAAIVFFLAFKAFTWPIYFLSILLTYAVIWLLVIVGIARREKVAIEVEKLVF